MDQKDRSSIASRQTANSYQIGGEHYRAVVQHWDLVAYNNMDYFAAQITKYATRWRKKNGVQDLEKALHYHAKLKELLAARIMRYPVSRPAKMLSEFAEANNLLGVEYTLFQFACTYTNEQDIEDMYLILDELMHMAKAEARKTVRS
jgi:hypothetical protein